VFDGLTDVYNKVHMGSCAENTAKQCGISRIQQDDFALSSYQKSADAWKQGHFAQEIVPVNVPQKRGIKCFVFFVNL